MILLLLAELKLFVVCAGYSHLPTDGGVALKLSTCTSKVANSSWIYRLMLSIKLTLKTITRAQQSDDDAKTLGPCSQSDQKFSCSTFCQTEPQQS